MATRESIFISYRRADTEGYAGRLADSLAAYFGEGRVFRDVGGITPGEDFEHEIKASIAKATVVLVLIGPKWLTSNDNQLPRLHDPDDHLAAEIAAALEQERVVIPVLVQDARMPLESDLPDNLGALVKRNAISLSDESWSADVTRLAANLAMDVSGSVAEKKLAWVQRLVLLLLAAPLFFGLIWLGYDLNNPYNPNETRLIWLGYDLNNPNNPNETLSVMGSAMIPLILAGFVLGYTLRWFHPSKQWCIWAALGVAVLGGILTFWLYPRFPDGDSLNNANYAFLNANYALTNTCLTLTAMLVFVGLSGFRPNHRTD